MRESTALGAALVAGSALRIFGWNISDPSTLTKVNTAGKQIFASTIDQKERSKGYALWNKAVKMCSGWNVAEEEEVGQGDDVQIKRGVL